MKRPRIRIRQRLGTARDALVRPFVRFRAWQSEIEPEGRVTLVGLVLASVGAFAIWGLPALLIPGLVLMAIGTGANGTFALRHPAVSVALVVAIAAVAIVIEVWS